MLNRQAIELLQAQPGRSREGWVFPGREPSKPLHNPRKAFMRVLKAAGIEEHVRIHDLRHSAASLMAQAGVSLYLIQQTLGHSTPVMTQRYAHIGDDPLRAAVQRVGDVIEAATTPAAKAA